MVNVSLAHEEALVEFNPNLTNINFIKKTLTSLGYKIRDPNKTRTFEEEQFELSQERFRLYLAFLTTLISLLFMVLMWSGLKLLWIRWIMILLALFTMFVPGWYIKKMAWASIKRGILNQHVLLEFAAFGGLLGGIYGFFYQPWPMGDFFGVTIFVTSYHILSGYVSLLVRTKSSQTIKKLMDLQPDVAIVIRKNGLEEELSIEKVKSGDKVRIRSGVRVPVDGIILKGSSYVDQSLVTGESIPILKQVGDEIIGGSVNQNGSLVVEVTNMGEESFLQKIGQHIREARSLKPNIIILVDKVLRYFVRGVLIAAILAFSIWTIGLWTFFGEMDIERAIFATLAVLVMGYPCALGMATPLAMIHGGGIAARKGILMRSGEAFQTFKDINKVVFDKTGTLTVGKPDVKGYYKIDSIDEDEFWSIVSSVENGSDHPLAKSVITYARGKGVSFSEVEDFLTIPGMGVQGIINDELVLVGKSAFIKDGFKISSEFKNQAKKFEEQGYTVINVAKNFEFLGIIAIGDTLKKDVIPTIEQLYKKGFEPIIISGDNNRVVAAIAQSIGIKEFYAEVMPKDKAEKVRELQLLGYKVAMVGDGINDAPALMQSDVGIAIGAGTDIAIESADIILVNDSLIAILDAYNIGKLSYRKTVENIAIAFLFNGIGVVLGIFGIVHPVWAMIAMVVSVTTILLNSFGRNLSKWRKKTPSFS